MSFPVTLHVRGRLATIAGGGEAARKKAAALHAAGALVRIVAPEIASPLRDLASAHGFELRERAYETRDLEDAFLAIAATSDDDVNAAVCADARKARILVCDASSPQRGDFSTSATVQIGDLTFAVDTGGAAPAFAKRLADELRTHFDDSYAAALKTLEQLRAYAKAELPETERAETLRDLAQLPIDQLAAMSVTAVTCATRGSALAMVQARSVAAQLAKRGIASTFLKVTTSGDKIRDRSIAAIGGESIFVKELEVALRSGEAQYAVHSCKDLPSTLPPDMRIAAVSAREDPRDVFCSERYENFAALPPGARVGTSSIRRRAQLTALRSDLQYDDVRGNVDTRLRKLRDGEYDAIVLAAAGLSRLRASARYMQPFELQELVPATGQGALAIEVREGEPLSGQIRAALNDDAAELAILCERAALRELRGGCDAPIGIYARFVGGELVAAGAVAERDGSSIVRAEARGPAADPAQAEALGAALAAMLERQRQRRLTGRVVVLPRTQERVSRIASALRAGGAEVLEMRSGEAEPPGLGRRIPDLIVFPSSGSVGAAAEYLARVHTFERRPAIAAMGPASSAAAHAAGFTPDLVAPDTAVDALVGAIVDYLSKELSS